MSRPSSRWRSPPPSCMPAGMHSCARAPTAYGVVIIAYSMGPAGPITAIRETSVVFAMIIGRLFLGETLTPKRIVAGLIVAAGAIAIGQ